jgi:hypothetical protein
MFLPFLLIYICSGIYFGPSPNSSTIQSTATCTVESTIEEPDNAPAIDESEEPYRPIFVAEKKIDIFEMASAFTQSSSATTTATASSSVGNGSAYSTKRCFNDDSKLKFDAREEFSGIRQGFVFRLGSQGLGYYEDYNREKLDQFNKFISIVESDNDMTR